MPSKTNGALRDMLIPLERINKAGRALRMRPAQSLMFRGLAVDREFHGRAAAWVAGIVCAFIVFLLAIPTGWFVLISRKLTASGCPNNCKELRTPAPSGPGFESFWRCPKCPSALLPLASPHFEARPSYLPCPL